jgi:hypothetical protein
MRRAAALGIDHAVFNFGDDFMRDVVGLRGAPRGRRQTLSSATGTQSPAARPPIGSGSIVSVGHHAGAAVGGRDDELSEADRPGDQS